MGLGEAMLKDLLCLITLPEATRPARTHHHSCYCLGGELEGLFSRVQPALVTLCFYPMLIGQSSTSFFL